MTLDHREQCVNILVSTAHPVAPNIGAATHRTLIVQVFNVCECNLSPVRVDTIKLNPQVRWQMARLTLFRSHLFQDLPRRVQTVTDEVAVILDVWHHQMEDDCMTMPDVPNEFQWQARAAQIEPRNLGQNIITLSRTV